MTNLGLWAEAHLGPTAVCIIDLSSTDLKSMIETAEDCVVGRSRRIPLMNKPKRGPEPSVRNPWAVGGDPPWFTSILHCR